MKRGSDREASPISKRSRSSPGRYGDSSDEDRDRRRGPPPSSRGRSRSPSPPRRYPPPPPEPSSSGSKSYKILCVSSLHPKASDDIVKDSLYREFKKFGELSINLVPGPEPEDRLAYVYFRNYEDAREAKQSTNKQRIILYDKPVVVEAVHEGGSSRGRPRSRSPSPRFDDRQRDRDRYRPRSPEDRHRYEDRYESGGRSYGGAPPPPHRDYRSPPDYAPRPIPTHHGLPRSVPMYAPPPPHHASHGGGGGGGHYRGGFERNENKKDRYPNYLQHISPEDDPLATRTLFAGNMEINITEEEIRRIFGRYGVIEDIDIKRPPPGTGNAYAFIRFENLDMANRSKVALSGQYIGKFQCKIGYGKATPTTRIWVGGLGSWTSLPQLEREFDRFGAIKKIEYNKGDPHAYIWYETIDAATAAVQDMRGFPLGGPDRRLRTDFSDPNPGPPYATRPRFEEFPYGSEAPAAPYTEPDYYAGRGGYRGRGGRGYDDRRRGGNGYRGTEPYGDDWARRAPPADDYESARMRSRSPERARSRSPRRRSPEGERSIRTLPELARRSTVLWSGGLILKNSSFPLKLHLMDGDGELVDTLLKDDDGKLQLRITQRLRLDQSKLDDVSRRMTSSASHAVFLGLPTAGPATSDDASIQSRPLRNLVSYLKQKEAAGVISLSNKDTEVAGVLYAFPPCTFSTELLRRNFPGVTDEALKEDHLVVAVVRGGVA